MASEDMYSHDPTPGSTSAALTTLFAETQGYQHLDLAIDPSLEDAAPVVEGVEGVVEGAVQDADQGADGSHAVEVSGDKPLEAADDTPKHSRHESATGTPAGGPADGGEETMDGADEDEPGANPVPGAKRKATSRINMLPRGGACEFCKRRKLKCTAEQPQCRACARSGRECVYSQKQQRSRVRVLEDKLLDLERRLDQERQANATGSTSGPTAAPNTSSPSVLAPTGPWIGSSAASVIADVATSATASPAQPIPTHFLGHDAVQGTPSAGFELYLGISPDFFNLADMQIPGKGREPDLMTLADAAANDSNGMPSWPWEGMSPAEIATEVYKTVIDNHKGMGEKIVAHLLQSYARPRHVRTVHMLVDPNYFFDRLTGVRGQAPHPSLVAAMIPSILSLSPSPTLNSRQTIAAVTDIMIPASRTLAQHALSNLDSRVIDLVTAAALRQILLSNVGRFVDAWNENSLCVGLAWSTGIGKLGGVMEEFAPAEHRSLDRAARHEREQRVRTIRAKGVICPPPLDSAEAAHRLNTFWGVYIQDRLCSIGWNWPSVIDYTEISTPLPRESYDTTADLLDNTTLEEFMSGRNTNGSGDGILCLQVKALTILHEASRLLDKAPTFATPDKTAHLMRISRRFMTTIPPFTATNREEALRMTGVNEVWMIMHTALMLLYGKDEVDAASAEEAAEACDKGMDAALKMCDCLDAAAAAGDTDQSGSNLETLILWCITGRTMHHYRKRFATTDPPKAQLLDSKIRMLIDTSRKATEALRLAEVCSRMLLNITLGAEAMLGEYERPDNVDFTSGHTNFSPL